MALEGLDWGSISMYVRCSRSLLQLQHVARNRLTPVRLSSHYCSRYRLLFVPLTVFVLVAQEWSVSVRERTWKHQSARRLDMVCCYSCGNLTDWALTLDHSLVCLVVDESPFTPTTSPQTTRTTTGHWYDLLLSIYLSIYRDLLFFRILSLSSLYLIDWPVQLQLQLLVFHNVQPLLRSLLVPAISSYLLSLQRQHSHLDTLRTVTGSSFQSHCMPICLTLVCRWTVLKVTVLPLYSLDYFCVLFNSGTGQRFACPEIDWKGRSAIPQVPSSAIQGPYCSSRWSRWVHWEGIRR